MSDKGFDFGAMVDDQLRGIRRGYKFGRAFNDDKMIVRPKTHPVEVGSDDNATVKGAWERNEPIAGLVEKEIKGGYEVTVAGARAFCPFSQIDRFRTEGAEYLQRKFDFLVTEYSVDERGLNVIVSRRALLERDAEAARAEALARLVEGETVTGTVTRVLDFGAFVDLGGIEGLIPAREVAWERVEDLNKVLKSGDGVTVKVMRVDAEAQRISLSRRECLPRVFHRTPEEEAAEKSAAEVAAWMRDNAERNASVGSLASAFRGVKLGVALVGALIWTVTSFAAPLRVSGIFSDHMVLQRGKPHPVWGTANAGARVTVAFAGQRVEAVAGRDGAWQATLSPLALAKTPQTMTVACGAETVSFSDLLVGDVWLITGQSNAEMRMGDVLDKEREMATSKDFPQIRSTKFAHRRAVFPAKDPCNGPWFVCTEKTLPTVTAMGWFFAREVVRETGVPVGILDNNWGGCAIEPYISREGFASVPALKHLSDQCESQLKELGARGQPRQRYNGAIGELEQWRRYANERERLGLPIEYYPYRVPGATQLAGQHNAMIAPIARLPIVGIAWYQGCSNAGDGEGHVAKLDALVNGWRSFWGEETPFYIIQLSTWKDKTSDPAGGDGFARIRNGQRLAAEKIPHSGLVVTIDIGADNNWDIHPKNKLDVGIRLAKWALHDIYGKKGLVVSGPRYAGMTREGDAIRVRFNDCGSGLMAGSKLPETPGVAPKPAADGVLKGFAIAGADRKWTWAQAKIDGNTVVLSAPGVKAPVAVRYAHRMNPQGACNLYNREGLPASPFRTDSW